MFWPLALVWLASVASASAQVSERLDIGAIVRTDRVSFEGSQNARLPVMGVGVSYRVWRDMRIEGEVTHGIGRVETQLRSRLHFLRGAWLDARGVREHGGHREAHDDQ